jgi:hypothetical protein
MIAQTAANIEAVTAGNHDVQEKQRGRPALGVGNEIGGGVKEACFKARRLKMMLHQPGYIGVVFQNKYGLAQNHQSSSRGQFGCSGSVDRWEPRTE